MRDVVQIETERLVIRPVADRDCGRVALYLADLDVSRMTGTVPHPYPPIAAEGWLMLQRARAGLEQDFVFAIDRPGEGLIGVIGLHVRGAAREIGYWLGKPHWGNGFATEALEGFVAEAQSLGELDAGHFLDNPASGRVLEKAGFEPTGEIRPTFSVARGVHAPSRRLKRQPSPAAPTRRREACAA